ncbi:MAG: tRNA (adenosine(37)-N6)-threonylcarbamoyltransferase complex dimerization subunit type 1 TsaB [Methylophilales bacterium]|nr:tRNA (adenosine(37)-N6)-threonylcarbamoyltransferase complex dimerization subunit type 1 TsaB [Methylophilales bacterium]
MKLLALDTSTEYLSLALWQDGAVTVREMLAQQKHSSLILPLLREVLDEAGMQLSGLDGIAFGAGPGSFTGLRIACGVAQGLAFGVRLPVVGVCTLEALAEQSGADKVIACLDARMGEVYHAAYVREGDQWQTVCAPSLCQPTAVPKLEGNGWYGIGSGWDVYADILNTAYPTTHVIPKAFPLARHIATLAAPVFERGEGKLAHEAHPLYIRNKVAFTTEERAVK